MQSQKMSKRSIPPFIDLPVNWFEARDSYVNRPPPLSFLSRNAAVIDETEATVFVANANCHDTAEIRAFLRDHDCAYRLFGRFSLERADYEVRRTMIGLTFLFTNVLDAVYFKLRWGGPAISA